MTRHRSRLPIAFVVILGRLRGTVSGLCAGRYHHPWPCRTTAPMTTRSSVETMGCRSNALNLCMKKAGPSLSPGLRAGVGPSRKGLASRGRSHQGTNERAISDPRRLSRRTLPAPTHSDEEQGILDHEKISLLERVRGSDADGQCHLRRRRVHQDHRDRPSAISGDRLSRTATTSSARRRRWSKPSPSKLNVPLEVEIHGDLGGRATAAFDGKADMIFGIYYNDERAKYLDLRPAGLHLR